MTALSELTKGYKRAQALNAKEWPKTFKARFIQPGLVHYDDMGTVLVERPALNKMAKSIIGKPVIDQMHKDVSPDNFKEVADGVVIRVWTDPVDGWDWCEFLVWDEETMRHCQSKEYSVSCAYTPTKVKDEGGKHNNLEYDGEFMDGVYTHLAIVKDPRYEQAKIVMNSKGAKSMFELFRRKPVENAEKVSAEGAFLLIDGEQVPLTEAVAAYEAQNSKAMNLKDDDVIRVNGKDVTGKELKNAYMAEAKRKNAQEKGEKAGDQEDAEKKEKEEGKKRDKGEAENEDDEDEDKKKEKKENRKNDVSEKSVDEDTGRRDKIDAKNSNDDEGEKNLKEFRETAEMRNNDPGLPTVNTMADRLALGKSRYGGVKKEAA